MIPSEPPASTTHGPEHRATLTARDGRTVAVFLTADHRNVVVSGENDSVMISMDALATHPDETGYAARQIEHIGSPPSLPETP